MRSGGIMVDKNQSYRKEKLSFLRKAVIASASVTRQKNIIHSITEADVSVPRRLIREYKAATGTKLSFTGYIVCCLAKTILRHPALNSFIRRNTMVFLNSITISVLIERHLQDASVPEPLSIQQCESKTVIDITERIRAAQGAAEDRLGSLSGNAWFARIPRFLLKTFVKLADSNVAMGVKYGKLAVTAAGMYSREPVWFIPHGGTTVLVTVGSIVNRVIEIDGKFENREHLCLTVSFDHDIIDGAPAARFMSDFIEEIQSGRQIPNIM